ncbi:MAG: histidine triad nucleotide-binding protein [Candidatus Saelkia tenebricola]|nr:histidine triad nucleotide-binding protein [Candidatus Saelkia tenebricola]
MECIFCKIIEKEIPSVIVYEDSEVIAFNDIIPQAPVHIIIIPKKHIEKISDITSEDIDIIGKLIFTAKNIAKEKGISESGYRLVFNCNKDAGQAVFHIHLHLLGGRKLNWPPG